jgi:hypothetical protein
MPERALRTKILPQQTDIENTRVRETENGERQITDQFVTLD